MRFLDRFRHLIDTLFQSRRVDRELDEELDQWVGELTARHRARGASPAEARRQALSEIGSVAAVKQEARDERVGASLAGLPQDARYGWRALRRTPGFAALVVLTLGLGIGASTAIFSIVNTLLLAPLPYRDSSRLVFIWCDMTDGGYPRAPLSGPELNDLNTRTSRFTGFGAIWANTATLAGDGDPEQLRVGLVTTNFFSVLGADAALGRVFGPDDEQPGGGGILLSWAVFARRFGADSSIVGRRILVNGQPTTVVGVMPREFRLWLPADSAVPDDLQAWLPLRQKGLIGGPRGQQFLRVVGRMKPGVTIEDARADVTATAAAISREFTEYGASGRVLTTVTLQDDGVREVRAPLVSLFGGVLLLAGIACVNVANLLVARAAARRKTTALRMTLGAGAGRLVREHLVEGLILSGGGAIAGLGIAQLGLRLMVAWRPAGLDRIAHAHLDASVLGFACLLALVFGVLFSIAPLVEILRASPAAVLQRDGQRAAGRLHLRTRAALVVTELALGVVLVVGAGLLGRTFVRLQRVDPGFATDRMLTFRLALPFTRYRSRDAIDDFSRRLQANLAGVPGITGVGAISHLPFDDLPNWGGPYAITSGADETKAPDADYRAVSPGLLDTLGARLLEGRFFTESDDKAAQPAIIVDDLLARRAWPGETALGRQIAVDPGSSGHPTQWATIVGVVRHLRLRSLSEDLTEQVFFPVRQTLRNPMAYVVRTGGDPAALAGPIRAVIHQMDAELPVYDVRPLESYVGAASASRRFTACVATGFAGVALLLGAVGVYGLIAYGVARRRTEFGVRLALGAHRSQVVQLVLREGLALGALGLALGAAGALAAARWLQSQLYGVTPLDPATYAIAIGVLAAAVLASSWLPAWRAAASDPLVALRDE